MWRRWIRERASNDASRRGRAGGERGALVVEMAIVLPLLLLIFIGMAEFGRAFFQYNTLTKSVRDGGRYLSQNALDGTTGVVDVSAANSAVDETKNLVVYGVRTGAGTPLLPSLTTGDVTVTDAGGGHVTVSASYDFIPLFGPTVNFGFGPISLTMTLRATVSMRALA